MRWRLYILFTYYNYHFRTATSWIREGQKSLYGRGRKQIKLKDRLLWPELWWVTVHKVLFEWSRHNYSIFLCLNSLHAIGVHQSKQLPHDYKCADSQWWCRDSSFQAAVPEVDSKRPDSRPGQSKYKRESGYVHFCVCVFKKPNQRKNEFFI